MDRNEIKEVASELVGWEGNKVFRTVKYLTINPGLVITEYCEGQKQKYLSPVVYFFAISGIVLYLQSATGFDDLVRDVKTLKVYHQVLEAMGLTVSDTQLLKFFSLMQNQALIALVFLPFSLIISWLVFKKHNPSFKDNSWFLIFTNAQTLILFIPVVTCFTFVSDQIILSLTGLITPAMLAYTIWAATQFYKIEWGRAIFLILLRLVLMMPLTLMGYAVIFYFVYRYVK